MAHLPEGSVERKLLKNAELYLAKSDYEERADGAKAKARARAKAEARGMVLVEDNKTSNPFWWAWQPIQ